MSVQNVAADPLSAGSNHATASVPIVSLNDLLLERATSSPDVPIIGVPNPGGKTYTIHTYASIYLRAARLAQWFVKAGIVPARKSSDGAKDVVVALLATSGWEYIVFELAIFRLGWGCVLLSTNNSVAALVSLITSTSATHLFYDRQSHVLHSEAQEVASTVNIELEIHSTPDPAMAYEDTTVGLDEADLPAFRSALFATAAESPDDAFCIHSSGSTGFPKPIWISHRAALANITNNFNLRGFVTLPLFHAHGHSAVYRAFYSRKQLFLYPTPPLPLTAAALVAVLNASNAELFYAVPYVLKLLSETDEGTAALRQLKLVTFGGSACPDDVGDRLVRAGVKLVGHYGTTEVGQLMTSVRDFETDKDWSWVRSSGARSGSHLFADHLLWEPVGDDTFELVVKKGWPPQMTSNRPDGSYATSDLFIRHPTNPFAFKYVGRRDDTLVHANGEKTAPVPMELSLRESPLIDEAIVFGAGRMQAGALIVLSDRGMSGLTTVDWSSKHEEFFRKAIWSAVENANERAPTHSRLLPEMVRVLPLGTHIPKADKGSIIRAKVNMQYASLIDETYSRFENGSLEDGAMKVRPASPEEMMTFIAKVVASTIGPGDKTSEQLGIGFDDDFAASVGINSLQAARIRNVLQRDLDLGGAKLGSNIVFEHPTAKRLAGYLFALIEGHISYSDASPTDAMLAMVETFSASLEPNINGSSTFQHGPATRTVVLTGATGSLGAHLLDQLLKTTEVTRIYCLCRAENDAEARVRVQDSLRQRHVAALDERTSDTEVYCLASNVEEDCLGINPNLYDDMVDAVTDVIHNAWPVNFNMAVESFGSQIGGARNLLNLCLRHGNKRGDKPASFFFSSSISALVNSKVSSVVEDFSDNPNTAQNIGYARSKWTVEQLCKRAAESRGVRAQVLRIGQMVGDAVVGQWQTTEVYPLMFKGAQAVGALPDLQENVSWLPVDVAAQAIIELLVLPVDEATKSTAAVYHILNPHLTSWSSVLDGLSAAGLRFERIPPSAWLARLRTLDETAPDAARNPVLKLRAFFEDRYGASSNNATKRPSFETTKTAILSPALANATRVDAQLIAKFVRCWKEVGFLL